MKHQCLFINPRARVLAALLLLVPAGNARADLQVTAVTLDRLDLRWEPVAGAERYHVYRAAEKGFVAGDDNWVATTTGTSLACRDLAPATTYYFQVRPVVGGKETGGGQGCGTTRHKDLALVAQGTRQTVEGDAFQVTWDAACGGEIVGIEQYDGADWVGLLGDAGDTVPGLLIEDAKGGRHRLNRAGAAEVRIVKRTPDEVALRFEAGPRTETGETSPLRVAQTYRVFREGVLFCDLEIAMLAGVSPLEIRRAELGLRLDGRLTATRFRWAYFDRAGWQLKTWRAAADAVAAPCMYPYAAADYGLSAQVSFTNHVAVFIEDWRALCGPKESAGCRFGPDPRGGMAWTWVLFEGSGRFRTSQTYRNRWGLALGAMRKRSRTALSASRGNNLIGARYYHMSPRQGHPPDASPDDWPWHIQPRFWSQPAPSDVYPSNEEIDAAARLGTNVFVLHQSWMRCGGSNNWPPADYTPQNPAELKRVADRCHSHKMRFGLYMRGTEAYALYMPYWEQFCTRDLDGLYVDWNGPLYYNMPAQGCFRPSETHFAAYDYFRYTRMLRRRVGEGGFLIGHTGACPTLLALAVFDGYLPGEFAEQKARLLDSPDAHVHFGMGTACGTIPISYTAPHDKAVAYSAGLGTCLQMERGPLWQIWRSAPVEKATLYNNLTENLVVATSTQPDLRTSVYRIDREQVLVVTANLGVPSAATLRLDMAALGLTGAYRITELSDGDTSGFTARPAGVMRDGVIHVDTLARHAIRGYKLDRLKPERTENPTPCAPNEPPRPSPR